MKKVLLGLVGVLVLATAAVFVFHIRAGPLAKLVPKPAPAVQMYDAGSFLTNLDDPVTTRYIKVDIELKVRGTGATAQLKAEKAQVDDAILAVLRSRTPQEVSGSAGMGSLQAAVAAAVDRVLTHGKVLKVYFTTFMVE